MRTNRLVPVLVSITNELIYICRVVELSLALYLYPADSNAFFFISVENKPNFHHGGEWIYHMPIIIKAEKVDDGYPM